MYFLGLLQCLWMGCCDVFLVCLGLDECYVGFFFQFVYVYVRGGFYQYQVVVGDVEYGQIGDDVVDYVYVGQWQGVVGQDFVFIVFGGVFYQYYYVLYVGYQVYCIVYVFDYFVGYYLVGQVFFVGDLYCVEDGQVDVVVMDYCEVVVVVEVVGVGMCGDGLFVGIDQVGIDFVFGWEWVDVEQVVFGL